MASTFLKSFPGGVNLGDRENDFFVAGAGATRNQAAHVAALS
jgi:hypothetical protein